MKKILIAALTTSFALGVSNTYASEPSLTTSTEAVDTQASTETPVESTESQNDKDVLIYEIEANDPNDNPDYIILYNRGNETISLNGWYIEDDGGADKRFTFGDRTIAPGEKIKLAKNDPDSFTFGIGKKDEIHLYNQNSELIHEYSWTEEPNGLIRFNLENGGFETIPYANEELAPEEDLDQTPNETEVVESGIIINEVQSKGANGAADYVELKNTTDKDVSLKGWYILDDDDTNTSTPLGDITIPAGGYVVLTDKVEFDFGLGKNDKVSLYNAEDKLVDEYSWQSHEEGKVWSRDENGNWSITDPTPGAENAKASQTPEENTQEGIEKSTITEVAVNEIESSAEGGGKDYAEIYNKSDKDIDISGWYILDNKKSHDIQRVKEGTILKPGEYFVFEEGVDFDFGLGSNDEVNLYDKDDKLVDKYSWTSHANGVYGRYPDGTGEFVDSTPSKGKANNAAEEVTVDVDTNAWPGLEDITILDETSVFDLTDLSGLDNKDGWLYGVNNKEGRFFVFRVVDGKVEFAPGFDNKGKTVNFKNEESKDGPDSEGITVDDEGRVYLAVERDNSNKNENFNVILQVADPFKDEKAMVAEKEWNITSLLPDVGANLGIETIEWVSFDNLNGLLYDQIKNKALDKNDYKDAYADGVFFVGLEANGHIYALVLKEDETAELIADIDTGIGGVMGMDYDLANNVLWAQSDDGYNNIHTVIQFNGTKNPSIIHLDAPQQMNKGLNNEGFVIDPEVDEDGNRNTYWFMDGQNHKAFRNGKLKADYMKDLGLSVIQGKESDKTTKDPDSNDLEEIKAAYKKSIEALYNLYQSEKDAYIKRLDKASTKDQYKSIYDEAVALHSSRVKVPTPEKQKPASSRTWTSTTTSKSNKVVVGKGYKYIKAGTYDRKDLETKRENLKESLKRNQIQAQAAKFLLEYTPKTVAKIKPQLEELIREAEKLQEQARAAIKEVDEILK